MESSSDERSYEAQQLLEVAEIWKHNRGLYPGWIVLPSQNRRVLWRKTKDWIQYVKDHHDELELGKQIWVLEELLWRIQRCLRPIGSLLRHEISTVFHDRSTSDWIDETDQQTLRRWLRIGLALLQSHRWNGEYEKFRETSGVLVSHSTSFPDLRANLEYEHILHDLGQGDTNAVTDRLDAWEVPDSLPFWKIKRAGVRIEVGNAAKGLREIDEALARIRRSSSGKTPSYGSLSKEGFALLIRDLTRRANQDSPSSNVDRWTKLANYRADIRTQVEELMEQVQSSSPGLPKESYVYEDPLTGLTSGRFSFSEEVDVDDAIRPGYQLAAYLEAGGIPVLYHFSHHGGNTGTISELKSLPQWLRGAYPWYTLSLLTRMQKPSDAHNALKYYLLFGPHGEVGEGWADLYSKAEYRVNSCLEDLKRLRDRYESHTHESVARYKLNLSLLALLTPFLSNSSREETLELAIQIYLNEENGHLRKEMRNLFYRLLKWVKPSFLARHLLDLLRFPDVNFLSQDCDPFQVGNLQSLQSGSASFISQHTVSENGPRGQTLSDRIDELIRSLDYVLSPLRSSNEHSDTDWYSAERILWRLLRLRQVDLPSGQQVNRVVELVWEDAFTIRRLVSETDLEIDHLLNLPYTTKSKDVNHRRIIKIAKRTIRSLNYRGKIFEEGEETPNIKQVRAIINTSRPQDPLEERSMNAGNRVWIAWTPEELEPILDWIEDKVESIDSHRLGPITQTDLLEQLPFGTDNKEVLKRLPRFITRACLPAVVSGDSLSGDQYIEFETRMAELAETMVQRGLPARSALASLHRIGQVDGETIQSSVNEGLGHQERSVQIDAAEAVYRFCVDPEGYKAGKTRLFEVLIRNVLSLATRGQGALEGAIRWLHRCVRDAPDIVQPQHYSDLSTLLKFIRERVHPPDKRDRVEAQNDEVRNELARWIQKKAQSIRLGVWLSKIQIESENDTGSEMSSVDAEVDIPKLTSTLATSYPHPRIRRAFNETIEEAGLEDTFDPVPRPKGIYSN